MRDMLGRMPLLDQGIRKVRKRREDQVTVNATKYQIDNGTRNFRPLT